MSSIHTRWIRACLRIAVEQYGLPVVPDTLASFREACELCLSSKGALLAVDIDCFFNPIQAVNRCSDYWEFPLCSMETRSPLLTTLSEVSEYAGPTYLEYDNEKGSPAARFMEYMIDTCIDAATQNDHGIRRMPIKIVLSRIHRMLEESRWDSNIAKAIGCTDLSAGSCEMDLGDLGLALTLLVSMREVFCSSSVLYILLARLALGGIHLLLVETQHGVHITRRASIDPLCTAQGSLINEKTKSPLGLLDVLPVSTSQQS